MKPSQSQIRISDEETRFAQYAKSVKFWCSKQFKVVIIENSQSFEKNQKLKDLCPDFVSIYSAPIPTSIDDVNYGTLEAEAIISYLGPLINSTTYFIKVTGRLRIPNVEQIIDSLECKYYRVGCPIAYVNPYFLPPPHSQSPFIDATLMIYTARAYLELLSVKQALPKMLGYPIERSLSDHLITTCSSGFDINEIRKNCGISFLKCVKRDGIVGWSGSNYENDADCLWNRHSNPIDAVGLIPPVMFYNASLLNRKSDNKVAILGFFEETEKSKDHKTTNSGLQLFLASVQSNADVFVFARKTHSSLSTENLISSYGQRYILFNLPSNHLAPTRYFSQWDENIIGGAPKFFFLRFVVYFFAIEHFLSSQYTHIVVTDLNDVLFQGDKQSLEQMLFGSQNRLIQSTEFNHWNGTSTSSQINRMWLSGCSKAFSERLKVYRDIRTSKASKIIPNVQHHINITKCTGGTWTDCQDSLLQPLPLNYVSCAGTSMGSRATIQKYLYYFYEMNSHNLFCNDQGLHNIIVNFGFNLSELGPSNPSMGAVLTIDGMDDSHLRVNRDFILSHSSNIININRFHFIHQYNRCSNHSSSVCLAINRRTMGLSSRRDQS